MGWEDNYSKLVEEVLKISDKKEWRFVMEEHKTKGTMQFGVRQFTTEGSYVGPTKNGILISIDSQDQVEEFRKKFNEFIDKVIETL